MGVLPAFLAVEDCSLSLKIILEKPQKHSDLKAWILFSKKKYYSEKNMYYYSLIIPGIWGKDEIFKTWDY